MLIVTIMLGVIFVMVLHFTQNSMQMESFRQMQSMAMDRGPKHGPRRPHILVHFDDEDQIEKIDTNDVFDLSEEEIEQIILLTKGKKEPSGVLSKYELRYMRIMTPEGMRLVLADISYERSMLTNLVRDCLVIGAISLVLFFFVSVLLSRWAVKPVERAWVQQRQFVADASHELKTPLTVILTNAELLQSCEYPQEQKNQFVQNVALMGKQMKALVEGMLELARADCGVSPAAKKSVNMSAAVEETVLSFEVLFFESGLSLKSETEENIYVFGVEGQLRQILEILLDNAIKYSLPGQTLVSLVKQGHNAVLSVSNPGEALQEEQLRDIFKRFYRADQARSRDGSFGLGLSIAQQLVHDHGGKIKAYSENGRNTFVVSLPVIK